MVNKLDLKIAYENHRDNIESVTGLLSLSFEENVKIIQQVIKDIKEDSKNYISFNDYWNDQ